MKFQRWFSFKISKWETEETLEIDRWFDIIFNWLSKPERKKTRRRVPVSLSARSYFLARTIRI